jgi:myo-inositol 2-dehydrogenase/D-chiro-inositol 1-dehydrogenase
MSDLKIGVIGTGNIGKRHIKRIKEVLSGGRIVAVADAIHDSAREVAATYDAGFVEDPMRLISDRDVEAVIVSSWDPSHKEYVIECIKQGKPVFCEKPLATTAADCEEIVKIEMSYGKKLVQVGFMRRFDREYRKLRQSLSDGRIGHPLIVHCAHRNEHIGDEYEDDYIITQCCIHEIDLLPWLLDDEYRRVKMWMPRKTDRIGNTYQDPQIALIETKTGICIDIELFVNCGYGYDIRCQVIGEDGVLDLSDPSVPYIRQSGHKGFPVPLDWEDRFTEAYNTEIQEWINATKNGTLVGSSAWDGYVAAVVADAMITSRDVGDFVNVEMPTPPEFYR